MQTGVRVIGVVVFVAGLVVLLLAPLLGSAVFDRLWSVEPLSYIGAVVLLIGLGVTSLSFFVPIAIAKYRGVDANGDPIAERWAQITQQYFDLFDHDLGRPMRRISGKERELRAILQALEKPVDPSVEALLDEIEIQTPNFRLMMSNIQVLVQLESPNGSIRRQPVEPSEVVRKIVDRYTTVAEQANKEITWWCEPSEFGLVYSDGSAIEHIVTNLVDNAVRFATSHIEVKLTRNPRMFFVRVWDDGPGIAPQYVRHVFDHGWTPEMARREEKSSSGLGLFIVQTLAKRWQGDVTLESVFAPDPDHHTAFLLGLPLGES
ncbi:MAG: HAMP domain-containing histidine kinase [Chloroflexi bacterium]|nr:HAMP domain-containing histidine kinase [Chloroflexota bacterium]MCH8350010.1 HAMP domain-containing histidine kinase [Chloroflexota bacterium]MCI0780470.1 HAMP domain-containing histidine kinase [Chloroflexota bacterium]MCI0786327.1 HAMP domain-containing histidine kinase [Chloroflexota bacterium]MCI0797478.1 HAMP domain-containing histidine kinase [Chloroflexota bacterium]